MRVLFDQNVPANLIESLAGHEIKTAAELGWGQLVNGDLLRAAEDVGFELFLTADQSLRYQQNLAGRQIAIVLLTRNNWPKVKARIPEIITAINNGSHGDFIVVQCG
jgi:hypothetical protein